MGTPIQCYRNSSNKKRIHLSPLAINTEGNFKSIRYREHESKKNNIDCSYIKKAFSLQNLSGGGNLFNINYIHDTDTQSLPKLRYDDRFISRPIRDMPATYDALNGDIGQSDQYLDKQLLSLDEEVQEKYDILRECISEVDVKENRILSFNRPQPKTYENATDKAVDFVRTRASKPKWKLRRCIPKIPDRVLDAPELVNDYYINVLNWGGENCLSIGLGNSVYVWSGNSGNINKIEPSTDIEKGDYVSSVKWSGNSSSSCLAVGYSCGIVKLFDVRTSKCLRTLRESTDRVPSSAWNENILSCGSRKGVITNYDVRVQEAVISRLKVHTQEVCGLEWSTGGKHLASGSNDNNVYVWEKTGVVSNSNFLYNFVSHRAAVKAVAWNPQETSILATGGGTSDHTLNFWNICTGTHLTSVSTNSQISGIVWNPHLNEFVTSHGHPQNQLTLWSYPNMEIAAHLISHSSRVLSISLSPDGTTVASVAGDETLRLWKCFDPPPKKTIKVENFNKPQTSIH